MYLFILLVLGKNVSVNCTNGSFSPDTTAIRELTSSLSVTTTTTKRIITKTIDSIIRTWTSTQRDVSLNSTKSITQPNVKEGRLKI